MCQIGNHYGRAEDTSFDLPFSQAVMADVLGLSVPLAQYQALDLAPIPVAPKRP